MKVGKKKKGGENVSGVVWEKFTSHQTKEVASRLHGSAQSRYSMSPWLWSVPGVQSVMITVVSRVTTIYKAWPGTGFLLGTALIASGLSGLVGEVGLELSLEDPAEALL